MAPAGVCRFCGCSGWDACVGPVPDDELVPIGCAWTDRTRTVCTFCAPAAKAEAIAIRRVQGYVRGDRIGVAAVLSIVDAFHGGFVVGWFQISARSRYGRNPYTQEQPARLTAWARGQRAGEEAGRQYRLVCGPLPNAPRRDVLRSAVHEQGGSDGRQHPRRDRRPRRHRRVVVPGRVAAAAQSRKGRAGR